MRTIRFAPDAATRSRYFVEASFQHPAKMHCGIVAEIAARYGLGPGDWVLDPMAGSGTTMLLALQGINVCLVELEQHFVIPMRASWEKMRQHPMLGYSLGDVLILRGDARHLPIASADAILSSPPFQDVEPWQDKGFEVQDNRPGSGPQRLRFRQRVGERTTGYTRPAAIVTSPPYEASQVAQSSDGEANRRFRLGRYTGDAVAGMGLARGYTRPAAIITSPPYEEHHQGGTDPHPERVWPTGRSSVTTTDRYTRPDCILTSPPYGEGLGHDAGERELDEVKRLYNARGTHAYAPGSHENIGNLRNNAYWLAMRQVYGECFRTLKTGGLLALVLKGYVRAGAYVDLPAQTAELVRSLGFLPQDHWRRELWGLSFWRILQRRRDPEAFDDRLNFEEVLAFRKPE